MIRIVLPALAFSLAIACNRGAECADKGDCADLQICDAGHCKDVGCATSADCGIGQYCDTSGDYTCKDGCSTDDDCIAGEACDLESHQCEAYECRSTDLDCALGEKCDPDSGRCENAMGVNCQTCSDPYFGTGCGPSATCMEVFLDQDEPWCMEACDPNAGTEACPRGFECMQVGFYSEYFCVSWCPALDFERQD